MKKINKILAGMSATGLDAGVAAYLNFLASKIPIKEVLNFHVFPSEYLFSALSRQSPVEGPKIIHTIQKAIAENVEKQYKYIPNVGTGVVVGTPLQEFKKTAKTWNPDLIALGKPEKGHGTLAKNILRHIDRNVLIVPEKATRQLSHILVPVDLSEYSGEVLQRAIALKKQLGEDVALTCYHAYNVPLLPAYSVFETEARFHQFMLNEVKEAFDKFINKYAGEERIEVKTVLEEEMVDRPSRYILNYAKKHGADFLLMGAQSHSWAEKFLGSTTERTINHTEAIPVLVMKKNRDYNDN
ncbi:MAG TPA: hypothetical protein ENJ20_00915 [Bacteroidetes bacterium]|nr:hypothetical protein [Bacteroidota bacterium]